MARSDRTTRTCRIARLLVALGDSADVAIARGHRLAARVADGPRGERLAILDHRERAPDGGDRLHEAWVLRSVLGWSERDSAKALDCSRTVLRRHLDARPVRSSDAEAAAIAAVRTRMAEVSSVTASRSSAGPRRGRRRLLVGAMAALVLAGLALATSWLT